MIHSIRQLSFSMQFITGLLVAAGTVNLAAQPWNCNQRQLEEILREERKVYSIIDHVTTESLDLKAALWQENRLHGQRFTIGFHKQQISVVEFHPHQSQTRPNWMQTLCVLFGNSNFDRVWQIDTELSKLFPSVTQTSVDPHLEVKRAASKAVGIDAQTGHRQSITVWDEVEPNGKLFWKRSTDHMFRYVLRRSDGKAFAIIEGSCYQSHQMREDAVNLFQPVSHQPHNVRRVMVATPDTFFRFLLATCGHKLENRAGDSRYEQQLAKFIKKSERTRFRRNRLLQATRLALQESQVRIRSICDSIHSDDHPRILSALTERSRLSKANRRRTLQLIGTIGSNEQIAYCQQFVGKAAYRKHAARAIAMIIQRSNANTEGKRQST